MIKEINRTSSCLILLFFLFVSSCNTDVVFTSSTDMKDNIWKLTDIPVYRVPVTDTVTANDIFFTIRTGSAYPFRNIYLFVTTTSPEGKSITDTLEYYLADEKGNWYGKGLGDINEMILPYRSNVFFPDTGTYQFKVQHGMRTENLKSVYDLGLRIEKSGR